jgi:hypothetical protein
MYHVPLLEVNADGTPGLAPQIPLVAPWGEAIGVYKPDAMTGGDWTALAGA